MAHGAVNASPIRRCPCPFCFAFFLRLQSYTFLRRQCQLMAGPRFELRTSCTGRANATHTPPRQNTLSLPKCPAVRDVHRATSRLLVRAETNTTSSGTACPTVFPALTASSCRRPVQHGSGELLALPFFANVSPPRQSFMVLLNYVCSCTITTL